MLAATTWTLLAFTREDAGDWARHEGARVLVVVLMAIAAGAIIRRIAPRALRPAVARQMSGRAPSEVDRRTETLAGVLVRTAQVVIGLLALFTVLPEFGFDIRPVLAGVGITGIALGLGAQALVRDVLNGIFIVGENQYAKGDIVAIAGVTGTVEDLTLRRTCVRDVDGVLYSVPNSAVIVAANYTRDYAKVRVTIPVAPGSDLAKVRQIADDAGRELARDEIYRDAIVDPPAFLRVDGVDANGVAVQITGTVQPGRQWEIAGAVRARVLDALRQGGIKTPWG